MRMLRQTVLLLLTALSLMSISAARITDSAASKRNDEVQEFFAEEDAREVHNHLLQAFEGMYNDNRTNTTTTAPGNTTTKFTTTKTTPIPIPPCTANETDYNRQYCYALNEQGYCYLDSVKKLCPQMCGVCGTTYTLPQPTTTEGPTAPPTTNPNCYEDNCRAYPGLYNCFTCPDQCADVNCTTTSVDMNAESCSLIAAGGFCSSAYIYCPAACGSSCSRKTCPTP